MKIQHEVRPEDILLYTDGDLRGGRRELVEAHLQHCPYCQRWLAEFEETGRLLRDSTPQEDSTAAHAQIMARIAAETGQRRQSHHPRIFAVLVALALALLIALALPWQRSEARPSVGRFFQFVDRGSQRSALVNGATPAALPTVSVQPLSPAGLAALPFTAQVPPTLPLGLQLASGTIARGSRLGLRYRNDRGLVMLLTQERAQDVHYTLTTSNGHLVMIGGVEVLVQSDPLPDTVAVLTWEDRGVLYALSAAEVPEGPVSFADARQIVEALLAER